MDIYANTIGHQRFPIIVAVVILVVSAALILSVSDITDADEPTSGNAGNDITWSYNTSTKILKITGAGDMWDFSLGGTYGLAGWRDLPFSTVQISEGITSIGDNAFTKSTVTKVQLPTSLVEIGTNAFSYTELSMVKFPAKLKTISSYAFTGTKLASIDLPEGLTSLGESAFADTPLSSLEIPSSLVSIGYGCFMRTNISDLTIPSTMKVVSNGAFSSSTITNLIIEEGVERIGDSAFSNTYISHLTIPDSVTDLNQFAFSNCNQLISVTLGAGMKKLASNVFYSCKNLQSVTLGENITTLERCLFYGCTRLVEFTITAKVNYLEINPESSGNPFTSSSLMNIIVDPANKYYESLDGVVFTKSLGTIFAYPPGRMDESYVIPDATFAVEDYAFYGTHLKNIVIPDTVVSLGKMSISVETLVLPDSVSLVADKAISAVHLTVGDGIREIYATMFSSTSVLRTLVLGANVGTIGEDMKGMMYLESVEITNRNKVLTSIGGIVYDKNVKNLILVPPAMAGSYIMPNTVEYIGPESFSNSKFTNIVLSENLKVIGGAAFRNNLFITSIKIPSKVMSIGGEAFSGCFNLEMVYFETSVKPYMGFHTFYLGDVDNWGDLRVYSTLPEGFMDRYAGKYTVIEYYDSKDGSTFFLEEALGNPFYVIGAVLALSIALVLAEHYISKRRQT